METLDLGTFKSCSEIKIITDNGTIEGHVISWQLQQDFEGPRLSLSLEIVPKDKDGHIRIETEIENLREEIMYQ